jgi:hypothetical protein
MAAIFDFIQDLRNRLAFRQSCCLTAAQLARAERPNIGAPQIPFETRLTPRGAESFSEAGDAARRVCARAHLAVVKNPLSPCDIADAKAPNLTARLAKARRITLTKGA